MCALNSPTDAAEPPLTAYDLAQACGDVIRALAAHLDTVTRIGVDGETRAAFRARGARPEKATVSLDCALVAYFAICRNAIGETSGTFATIADVADAMPARLDRNDRDINLTAMRRADTAEAADAALTASQRARGDGVLAALDAMAPTVEVAHVGDGNFVVRSVHDLRRVLPHWVKAGYVMGAGEAADLNREYCPDTVHCTTETAPCAGLTRVAETYDYGKSAAATASASHGAYERGFVSPASA